MTSDQKKLLQLARDRFAQAELAEKMQKTRELQDLRFYAGDQWPEDVLQARAATNAIGSPGQPGYTPGTPARPALTINKLPETVKQVLNQERQSDMGIELVPADDWGALSQPIDDNEIQLREGLIRRIQRESQAADARTWAFARAVQAGRGYYGVMTRYLDGKTFDQEIYVRRFYNQNSVTLDPAHEQPDGSDAEWAFIGTDMPWAQYKAEFGRINDAPNPIVSASDADFRALGDELPGWFTMDGETRSVRVVEYFYTERTTETIAQLPSGQIVSTTEVPEGITPTATRSIVTKQIKWAKLDGQHVLDETDWPGRYIPIIKVVGDELQPYDKERRCQGIVRPATSSCQGFNYMVSKQVEVVGLTPIPPWMGPAGFDEGFEAEYQSANTRALPSLHYNPISINGTTAPPPSRTPVDTPIQAIAVSIQLFNEAIKSTTGIPDPTLGNVDPSIRSGKAIKALLEQANKGTSNYLDNLARSIHHEAKIENDLLRPIYNRPGRLARMINGQGESETVMIETPFTRETPTSHPRPAPKDHPNPEIYRLSDSDFNIAIKVTKSYNTLREELSAILGELLAANPELMAVYGDLYFETSDFPGHEKLAERAKVMLAPQVQQALQGQQPPDPATQQKLQMSQKVIEELTAHVNELTQQLQAKQLELASKERIAGAQGMVDLEKAQIKAQTDLAVAEIKQQIADQDRSIKALEAMIGVRMAEIDHEREQRLEHHTTAHDAAALIAQHGHEARMAEQEHARALELGAQAHEQQKELTALQPTPTKE